MMKLSALWWVVPAYLYIARKLQHEAATLGMTAAEHDALMESLKDDL
jgi:hypothetical protein